MKNIKTMFRIFPFRSPCAIFVNRKANSKFIIMKIFVTCSLMALAALVSHADDKVVIPDSTGFKFTDVKIVKTTPVKDQDKSGTCWSFSSISFMEEEILHRGGDEQDLSEMFVVRHCYLDKAEKYVRMGGTINFAQGGSILDVPYVWECYGAMPEEAYRGLEYGENSHRHAELEAVMKGYLDAVVRNPNKKITTAWHKGLEGILDAYLGKVPETFTYKGKTYTPRSYADEMGLKMGDYLAFTSWTHHPFYKPFALEVADNWLWGQYENIPMDELKAIVDYAIDHDYTIAWAADVSEGGFKWRKGYAVLPKLKDGKDLEGSELARWVQLDDKDRKAEQYDIKGPVEEEVVTQESRQAGFDSQLTTDDHGMVIVGRAVDQKGNRYYKVKNSWNTNQLYNGYFYVSEPYFLAKTISLMVNRKAVPANILKKIGK